MYPTIRPLSGGRLRAERAMLFGDAPRGGVPMSLPLACWLVEHPRGRVLFDTGVHRDAIADPAAALGEWVARRFAPDPAEGDVVASLAARGLAPDDVDIVVNSHLHFDHCGCNRCFERAQILVQQAEWQAAVAARDAGGGNPRDWDRPLDYRQLDGEHDLFGDGSVVAVPTPGHTPGHQSLRVRTGPGRLYVMTGDACYTAEHLERDALPPRTAVWHEATLLDSMARLRRMRDAEGATLLFGHDDAQWQALGAGSRALS